MCGVGTAASTDSRQHRSSDVSEVSQNVPAGLILRTTAVLRMTSLLNWKTEQHTVVFYISCLFSVSSARWAAGRGGEAEGEGSRAEGSGGDGGRSEEGTQQDGAGQEGCQHQGRELSEVNMFVKVWSHLQFIYVKLQLTSVHFWVRRGFFLQFVSF